MRDIATSNFSASEKQDLSNLGNHGFVVLLTGSNASGKSSLEKGLKTSTELSWLRKVTRVTTRAKGKKEVEGKDYFFVDQLTFDELVKRNELLDWHQFPIGWYGTKKRTVIELLTSNSAAFIEADIEAALALKGIFQDGNIPLVDFFVSPISYQLLQSPTGIDQAVAVLEQRMRDRNRGESEEIIISRLYEARERLPLWNQFSYVVSNTNGHFDDALAELVTIIATKKGK